MTPERFHRLARVLARRQPDLTVLMERVHKPHNFSAILRNCDAAGVLKAHAVLPESAPRIHLGVSAGAGRWVPVERHESVEAAAEHLRRAGFQLLAAHLSDGAADYRKVDYTRPTALLMGAELYGVSDAGLAVADRHVVIPMRGFVQSLNVSVATALLLFEAANQREAAGMYARPRLSESDYRRTLFEWAYPKEARAYREMRTPYPDLDEDGRWVNAGQSVHWNAMDD